MTTPLVTTADIVWAVFTLSLAFAELIGAIIAERRPTGGALA